MASATIKLEESAAVTLFTVPISSFTPSAAATTSYKLAESVIASEALYHMATLERVTRRMRTRKNTSPAMPNAVDSHRKGSHCAKGSANAASSSGGHDHCKIRSRSE